MPYPVKAVANYFLDLADESGQHLDPMQIQKLVYFAHGWYLAVAGKPLVDEYPEAWTYGPVFPSLYHEFKQYGSGHIQRRALEWHIDSDPDNPLSMRVQSAPFSLDEHEPDPERRDFAKQVLRRVWDVYGSWTAVQLSQLTHVPDGPWDLARRQNPGRKGTDIDESAIRSYFRGKAGQPA